MTEFDPVAYINTPRWQESRLGTERIVELMERLGNPQDQLKVVHVAGTNGKGSICAYLSSILQEAGYVTGLFTSPYIEQFEERIRVNGQNISPEDLLAATAKVKKAADQMADHPTEFELMTAVAFVHFAVAGCQICVVEVGMGGRLDSTNVIKSAEVSVIAPIALDHCAILGNTLGEIAGEKAGIIKEGCPVVSCFQEAEAAQAISAAAAEKGSNLTFTSSDDIHDELTVFTDYVSFAWRDMAGLRTKLLGSYQPHNAGVALQVASVLAEKGWDISEDHMRAGIANAEWPGRFEVLCKRPTIVVDGGHNPQGAEALMDSIYRVFPGQMPVFVVGVLADKDHHAMLNAVVQSGIVKNLVCVAPPNPRALPVVELAHELRELQRDHLGYDLMDPYMASSIDEGLRVGMQMAGRNGVVVAFGSLYSVGEVKRAVRDMGLSE